MQSVFDAIPAIESYYKEGLLEEVPVEEEAEVDAEVDAEEGSAD